MATYLIEIPHSEDKIECTQAIQVFMNSGSHFLTHADWGCSDHVHKAWLYVDVDSREQALQIVPPLYRHNASIIKLTRYNKEKLVESADEYHSNY